MKQLVKKLLPGFILSMYYSMWPFLGMIVYRMPSRHLKVIGITGTNGKTTVTHLATRILEGSGHKVASISSLRFKIGAAEWKNELKMTMPGRMKIHKFMRDAVNAGCEYLVIEVTSEGIKQKRHKFIQFDSAAFTNLTPEHIESHGSFENYKKAKGEFFALPHKTSIVNLDDPAYKYFLNFKADKKIGYSMKDHHERSDDLSTVVAQNYEQNNSGSSFSVMGVNFPIPLLGRFNAVNALTAISIGISQGVNLKDMDISQYADTPIPGRMEVVFSNPFRVVVDYAHTPDALEKVYKTISQFKKEGESMVCVLGSAGGGRDKWKRPEFAKLAENYCDKIILTDEDPYDENSDAILDEIIAGFSKSPQYKKILDRREAIHTALKEARENDTVVITGKGAEPWLMVAHGEKIPWDDRKIVREEAQKLQK